MAGARIHQIRVTAKPGFSNPAKTACGMEGWPANDLDDEYETAGGNRFQAVILRKRVTCQKCLAAQPRSPE